jgi:hypothetical protein
MHNRILPTTLALARTEMVCERIPRKGPKASFTVSWTCAATLVLSLATATVTVNGWSGDDGALVRMACSVTPCTAAMLDAASFMVFPPDSTPTSAAFCSCARRDATRA